MCKQTITATEGGKDSSAGVTLQRNVSSLTAAFLSDVSLLDDDVQYLSCDDGSVGSVALVNTTLDTATMAYYTDTTPNSRACFVCDESSEYELNSYNHHF